MVLRQVSSDALGKLHVLRPANGKDTWCYPAELACTNLPPHWLACNLLS